MQINYKLKFVEVKQLNTSKNTATYETVNQKNDLLFFLCSNLDREENRK